LESPPSCVSWCAGLQSSENPNVSITTVSYNNEPLVVKNPLPDEDAVKQALKNKCVVELPEVLFELTNIDKRSRITQVELHRSSIMGKMLDRWKAYHVFVVYKTESANDGTYFWSLERDRKRIILQRSRSKCDVRSMKMGKLRRYGTKSLEENLKGKGTMEDLLAFLCSSRLMEPYKLRKNNCQTLATFIIKRITEKVFVSKGIFKYKSPLAKTTPGQHTRIKTNTGKGRVDPAAKGLTSEDVSVTEDKKKLADSNNVTAETRKRNKDGVLLSPPHMAARNVPGLLDNAISDREDPHASSRALDKEKVKKKLFSEV
jgi:hypothetical protein